jgi:hypothetical protein
MECTCFHLIEATVISCTHRRIVWLLVAVVRVRILRAVIERINGTVNDTDILSREIHYFIQGQVKFSGVNACHADRRISHTSIMGITNGVIIARELIQENLSRLFTQII